MGFASLTPSQALTMTDRNVRTQWSAADADGFNTGFHQAPGHRSLLSSATSVSRSLASNGASVSLVIASAFGTAFSASC